MTTGEVNRMLDILILKRHVFRVYYKKFSFNPGGICQNFKLFKSSVLRSMELYLFKKIKNRLSMMDAFNFKVVAVSISKRINGNPN